MITLDINSNYCDRGAESAPITRPRSPGSIVSRGIAIISSCPGRGMSVRRVGRRGVRIEVYGCRSDRAIG